MYEISFPKLSERYFKQGTWPPVDAISDLVDQDHVFCLLYKVQLQWKCNATAGSLRWSLEQACVGRQLLNLNFKQPAAAATGLQAAIAAGQSGTGN